jgi:hypothetical protein
MKQPKLDFNTIDEGLNYILRHSSLADMKRAFLRVCKDVQKAFKKECPKWYKQIHHTQAHIRQVRH